MKTITKEGGIYVIECAKYFYIGLSSRLRYRKSQHFTELNNNTHRNWKMQNVYNSGHKLNFKVIEECEDDLLEVRELYWFNRWSNENPNKEALNLKECGSRPTYSYEARVKMSKGKLGENHNYDFKQLYNLYDFDTNELIYIGNLWEISKHTNLELSQISQNKVYSSVFGSYVYMEEALDFIPIEEEITIDDLYITVT